MVSFFHTELILGIIGFLVVANLAAWQDDLWPWTLRETLFGAKNWVFGPEINFIKMSSIDFYHHEGTPTGQLFVLNGLNSMGSCHSYILNWIWNNSLPCFGLVWFGTAGSFVGFEVKGRTDYFTGRQCSDRQNILYCIAFLHIGISQSLNWLCWMKLWYW